MVKVWFPSMYMRLVSLKTTVTPPIAKLQCPTSMTKSEIKEYLTKIYNVNVLKVDTANYLGEFFFFEDHIFDLHSWPNYF